MDPNSAETEEDRRAGNLYGEMRADGDNTYEDEETLGIIDEEEIGEGIQEKDDVDNDEPGELGIEGDGDVGTEEMDAA